MAYLHQMRVTLMARLLVPPAHRVADIDELVGNL